MALHGEAADIRTLMRDAEVDPALKKALSSLLQSTANIVGLEGHRSQIRLRGHAAGWHYGNAHLSRQTWQMCARHSCYSCIFSMA